MADNAQKLPLAVSLNQRVISKVLQHVELMSGRAPASINIKDGKADTDDSHTIAMIKFETDSSTFPLPLIQLPIQGSEYSRRPWQGGEKGYVATADFDIGNMTALGGQNPSPFVRPANLSSLIFHAVGNMDFTPTDDKDSHVHYGKAGTIHRDVNKVSQVKTNATNGVSMSTGGDGSGADGPHNMKATTGGTETNTTQTHTTNAPAGHNVPMGPQTVKGDITSSSGNITSATGNVSAPSGTVSGQSGSFGGGSMGGLSMLAGVLSGGGSGGSPAVSIDTNSGQGSFQQVAAQIAKLPPMTYANLTANFPASATLVGARATVSDSSSTTFLGTMTGGGTHCVPAFCCALAGGGYQWLVG